MEKRIDVSTKFNFRSISSPHLVNDVNDIVSYNGTYPDDSCSKNARLNMTHFELNFDGSEEFFRL